MNFTKTNVGSHTILNVNLQSATIEHTDEFKTLFDEAIIDEELDIVINLSECEFIDSTFMGLLVRCHKEMQRKEGTLKIVCDGKVRFLLHDVTHLSSVISLYNTVDEAIKG